MERWDLGAGESAVLTFALRNRSFEAVLDDRAARNCAAALGVGTRGTLGILLLAKREGALAAVAPIIAALRDAGMYLDASLERSVLELAGKPDRQKDPALPRGCTVSPKSRTRKRSALGTFQAAECSSSG